MDAVVDFLIQYGYWGMFLAAFLAASIFPFSSEAVMVGLQLAGLDLDKNAVQRMESGQRFVTDIELAVLCRVLKKSYEELLKSPEKK